MKKGEIWYVEIPATNGYEQSGLRHVIIISELEANIVIVIPFTSNLLALKYPHTIEVKTSETNGLKISSIALVFQIRAIDKRRLKNRIGILEGKELEKINEMLKKILDLN